MEASRIAFYLGIALIVAVIAYYILAEEPSRDAPTNLIHLLFKH